MCDIYKMLNSILMHKFDENIEALAEKVLEYAIYRLKYDQPLDGSYRKDELYKLVGNTITEEGLGGEKVLEVFKDVLAPACISTDHPRYLSFIPSAPSEHSSLFDLVVGASALYAGSWLEGSGAVFAENQALRWLCNLANFPEGSGGVFVQGGTIGNLSALVTARNWSRERVGKEILKNWRGRFVVVASEEAHSSIKAAVEVMDVELLLVKVGEDRKLKGSYVEKAVKLYKESNPDDIIFALVGTAGSTNLGIVDELDSLADYASRNNLWFHVDGAYGLAALCAPSKRDLFKGIERASSFIVDPHKWLFAPFDVCALIYREPEMAKRTHTQHASYLESLEEGGDWNPTDYSIGLTRRARGLPFWFSLASNGTKEYSNAVEQSISTAREAARMIKSNENLELLFEPELSIVAFRRKGWLHEDYKNWSNKLLLDQVGFVVPSSDKGESILRFAIVNPYTSSDDIATILDTL